MIIFLLRISSRFNCTQYIITIKTTIKVDEFITEVHGEVYSIVHARISDRDSYKHIKQYSIMRIKCQTTAPLIQNRTEIISKFNNKNNPRKDTLDDCKKGIVHIILHWICLPSQHNKRGNCWENILSRKTTLIGENTGQRSRHIAFFVCNRTQTMTCDFCDQGVFFTVYVFAEIPTNVLKHKAAAFL